MTLLRPFSALLLLSSLSLPVCGQLQPASAGRPTDYHDWFAPLNPATSLVVPGAQTPAANEIDTPARRWTPWSPNTPPSGPDSPITGTGIDLFCEIVFLGETGTGWTAFGWSTAGEDTVLSASTADRLFGSYTQPTLSNVEDLDLFVERSDGSRYYVFDKTRNSPGASPTDGYWGTLLPLASCRDAQVGLVDAYGLPFAVFAFAPSGNDLSPELFVFAIRAGADRAIGPAVPEPSTYGVCASAVLLGVLALRRRWRTIHPAPKLASGPARA